MAFHLAFERTHRVLRATADGVVATQDLLDLDIELIAFLAREETSDQPPIRGLYDFSAAEAFAVPQTKAAERGNRPAFMRGQRVIVPSRAAACSLVDTFVQGQRQTGDNQITVARSVDEAHALLGLDAPKFEDIG
jgi:hypothetical protein